jgi:hypothetical protein
MVIDMHDEKLKTLEQIKEFMAGTEGVGFTINANIKLSQKRQ